MRGCDQAATAPLGAVRVTSRFVSSFSFSMLDVEEFLLEDTPTWVCSSSAAAAAGEDGF